MPIAKTPNEIWPYVLINEREQDKPTVFELKALSGSVRYAIKNIRFASGFGDADKEVVIRGLRGWKNFNDENGNPVEFKWIEIEGEKFCDESNFDHLMDDELVELKKAILDRDKLTEEEKKVLLLEPSL